VSGAKRNGKCLCGAVTFTATVALSDDGLHVDACHCGICRRQIGGPLMTVACKDLDVPATPSLGVYQSSDWGERGFCKTCGSNLFFRMRDGSFSAVNAGALDDLSDAKFTMEIFIDDKPAYYDFAQKTKKLTGDDVRALFAPKD
jgi:hypothetical protein